ncbi:hypothetical protein ABB02_01221 [Clostridiaceae bacterium JG1575]|nr:hypothetical protein ABB02_01221 [Clostridiaceae bacterium JG1575]
MTKKYEEIDGMRFPVKVDGMTLVDSVYIPDAMVEEYVKDREHLAEEATKIFKKYCVSVSRDYKGSQDGEAIVGRNADGEIQMFVHLDPHDIKAMKKAHKKGTLEQFLLEQ